MCKLLIIQLAISFLFYTQYADSMDTESRNLFQFANMIEKVTGKDTWDYDNYGCYCGAGGCGTPVDGTDRCCRTHDICYEDADNAGCSPKIWNLYSYSASYGYAVCNDKPGSCNYRICNCDRTASLCFYNNKGTYNEDYNNPILFDTSFKCKCKSQTSENINDDEMEEN